MLPPAVADLQAAQRARVAAAVRAAREIWAQAHTVEDAAAVTPRLASLLSAAMVGAAADGGAMVAPALAQTGFPTPASGVVVPSAFGVAASDGRPLLSLMQSPVLAGRWLGMDAGRVSLDRIVHTQIVDAGRQAASVAIAASPRVGWVRVVSPPSCQDCAVQAGRLFKWNTGFKRHPHCDCIHRPAHEREHPSNYTRDVPLDQITDLTAAQRAALENGADMSMVVNAYRDVARDKKRMVVPGAREAMLTTRSRAQAGVTRLTPDGIFATARSRREALSLLKQYGYFR